MNEEYSLSDFENVLLLRNQLVNAPMEKLIKYYSDYDNYLAFIDTVAVLSAIDSGFLLIYKEAINKISNIVQINRFKAKNEEEVNAINSVINYLNVVNSYEDYYACLLKLGYLDYQEQCRKVGFDSEEELICSLSNDAIVYCALKEGNIDDIGDPFYFLESINYLFETIPEFFKDEKVQERFITLLNTEKKKIKFFNFNLKDYYKDTKEAFQKIKTKEE
jgi:hypothetical protein